MANVSPLKVAVFALCLAGSVASASPALAVSATSSITATIVGTLTLTKTQDLNFGGVTAGVLPGTVVLGTDGARSGSGGSAPYSSSPGQAATFTVAGTPGASYAVTLPLLPVTLTGPSGASLTVTSFTNSHSTISSGGSDTLNVGGTLVVGASQAAGVYNGSFTVSVDYN